jgi:hypothetical protein
MCWIARAAVSQEKWSSGLREGLLTNHNGDVPNGYVWWACTPLRQWCKWILILAIHPNRDPNFSDPDFSHPNLGDELKQSDN